VKLFAVFTSLMGGAFMASAICYFVTIYSIGCCEDQLNDTWWAKPKAGPYVDFLLLMYKPHQSEVADVGLFSGEMWLPWPTLPKEHVNRFYAYCLWGWFFFVGCRTQLRELRESVKKEREGQLEEPLLPQ